MPTSKKQPPRRRRSPSPRPAAKPLSRYALARTKREEARARREHLALRKELGEVHDTKQCADSAFKVGRQIRDALLLLPARLAGPLSAMTEQHEIAVLLDKELRAALIALKESPSGTA
jgi:hypothetical protein